MNENVLYLKNEKEPFRDKNKSYIGIFVDDVNDSNIYEFLSISDSFIRSQNFKNLWISPSSPISKEKFISLKKDFSPNIICEKASCSIFFSLKLNELKEYINNNKLVSTIGIMFYEKTDDNYSSSVEYSLIRHKIIIQPGNIISNRKILVFYRFHAKNEQDIRFEFLKSFAKQFKNYIDIFPMDGYFYLLDDNSNNKIRKKSEDILSDIKYIYTPTQSMSMLKKNNKYNIKRHTLFVSAMSIIKEEAKSGDIIFFIEDDYLFRPEAINKTVTFLSKYPMDFVALQDHPNRYWHNKKLRCGYYDVDPVHKNYAILIDYVDNWHWRTTISTCYTFCSTYDCLVLNKERFLEAAGLYADHSNWVQMWADGKSRLWGPIPGLASHRGGPHLNDYNWNDIFDDGKL